jgi:hypothetical protein
MVGRDHDLHLGPRFTVAVGARVALGFTVRWFARPAIAARTALAAQVVVSDICQFVVNSTRSKGPEDRPPRVVPSMLSAWPPDLRVRLILTGHSGRA